MQESDKKNFQLPSEADLHKAIDIYLEQAYEGPVPELPRQLLPPDGPFNIADWLMGDMVERDPPDAPLEILRSAAFRLGNTFYPNMKLRISRPPNHPTFIFSVDCHDAVLSAKPGSADFAMLEELKAHNAKLADGILAAWDQAKLQTERNYLRYKINQARKRNDEADS